VKKAVKYIIGAIAVLTAYELGGALLPFARMKTADSEYKENVNTDAYYGGSEDGADRARVVEENKDALDTRLSMFGEAKESIILTTFDIREGKSTDQIFSSLIAAADRGVKVRIIVDGMYGMLHMNGKDTFYAAGSHKNIEIKYYNEPNPLKPWTFNGRMHDKYIIIDDQLLLLGGRNTFDYFIGEWKGKNRGYDREVLVYNTDYEQGADKSVIGEVKAYFESMWKKKECRTVFGKTPGSHKDGAEKALARMKDCYQGLSVQPVDYWETTVATKKISFLHNPTHIYGKEPYVWEELRQLMMQAEERVMIHTPYAVYSEEMYEGMKEISEKVPNTSVILNAIAVGDNVCASSDYLRNKNRLLNTGMDFYEYMGDYSTHGKSLVIDQNISVIGSYNFDNRSTYVDTETMLVIDSTGLNEQLTGYLEALKAESLKIIDENRYEAKDGVKQKEIPAKKKKLIKKLAFFLQPFRYLI